MLTPSNNREFFQQNPGALKEFQRRLKEKNNLRPEEERVDVKSLAELEVIVKTVPDEVTALLETKRRSDSFDHVVRPKAA
jgi:hypothetical protein